MSNIPLVRTKLHRPPVASVHVHRPRLLNELNNQQARSLTLISAPAGYGKSTLVSSWLDDCDLPSAWLSIDESDNDLRVFLSYFLAAVQSIFPLIGKEIQAVLKAPELPPVPVLAVHLINELDTIDRDFILVIDDFHLIQTRAIHELFEAILKHPPPAMHLVLAGRSDPPLSLVKLRARRQLIEIRMRQLRFSPQETADFLQQMLDTTIDESLAKTFEEKTEGWITGLHLAALSFLHKDDLDSASSGLPDNNRFVVDYLVSEILLGQTPAVQERLLKTSILDRFCAPLCDALCRQDSSPGTGELDGHEFIRLLRKSNLFVIPLDDERGWFRYHQSFQDLLRRRCERKLKPEEIKTLHANTSAWFSENGFIEEALQHANKSGDQEAAARLVTRHRHAIMNSEQWHRLERWVRMLPPGTAENTPDIVILRAWLCEIWLRLADLRTYLKQVASHFDSEPTNNIEQWHSLRAEFYTLSALLHYIDGDSDQTIDLAVRALQNLVQEAQIPRSLAQCLLSFGHQMNGDLKLAFDVLYKALDERASNQPVYQSRLLLALSMVHWIAADLRGMRQAAARILTINQDSNLPESVGIANHLTGIFYYLRNELTTADEYLNEVVRDIHEPNMLNFAHSAFVLSLSFEAQGRPDEARTVAEKVFNKALGSRSSEFLHLAEAFQAELLLRHGQLAKVQTWATNYNPYPLDPGYRFYVPQFTFVKVLLAKNSPQSLEQATELLSELHSHYSSIHNTRFLIEVLILQALQYESLGQELKARQNLSKAVALAEPGGFIRPFLDLGDPLAVIFQRLVKQEPCQVYARQVLEAFRTERTNLVQTLSDDQSPASAPAPKHVMQEPLTKREIQILNVLSQGLSNQAIAETLFISPETVKRHLYNIFQKLDVNNRQQAITSAYSLGLI